MGNIRIYGIENCDEWDKIVRSFSDCDIYWLSGYIKAFQIHGDGEPLLIYFANGKVRGINVVFKRDIADSPKFVGKIGKGELFDLTTPYGYGGWLIEGTDSSELFSEYEAYCKENRIVSEFVRFHPVIENSQFAQEAYNVVQLGKTVTMDLSSPDTIWENIISKNRNVIRKAQKNGVYILNGRSAELFEQFRIIYNETMDKDNADSYYYFKPEFYQSILMDLPYNAQVFYAMLDDQIIAGSIMLVANGRMNYHLSGSVREFSNLAPTNLLLYHAALWGSYNGCKTLYLGGGVGSGEDSLFKFKKAFNRQDDCHYFCIGRKIFDKVAYEKLVAIRNGEEINEHFFPVYRG
ncbi:MAG: GNAT family N-acetyltransferase [Ruminococcus sp.]|nr:GNAT family N-acetyltransferase [Ruminococcus sp.]